MVVPAVGKPGWPGCKVSSCTAVMLVTGWASEMTAMSFWNEGCLPPSTGGSSPGTKPGCRTKLVMPTPGLEAGVDDIGGGSEEIWRKKGAAGRIVRGLFSGALHLWAELVGGNRLTT